MRRAPRRLDTRKRCRALLTGAGRVRSSADPAHGPADPADRGRLRPRVARGAGGRGGRGEALQRACAAGDALCALQPRPGQAGGSRGDVERGRRRLPGHAGEPGAALPVVRAPAAGAHRCDLQQPGAALRRQLAASVGAALPGRRTTKQCWGRRRVRARGAQHCGGARAARPAQRGRRGRAAGGRVGSGGACEAGDAGRPSRQCAGVGGGGASPARGASA
mmetsp:Transcript_17372/g.56850  ORF Transcript_17372/g.56850 Transcript_17372/m.56850 type:complete len:220 (-) Transcript_17372:16-675(-)